MIPYIPKEIEGKIKFSYLDVQVKDGIVLNEEEEKIFNEFRKHIQNYQGLMTTMKTKMKTKSNNCERAMSERHGSFIMRLLLKKAYKYAKFMSKKILRRAAIFGII